MIASTGLDRQARDTEKAMKEYSINWYAASFGELYSVLEKRAARKG